MDMALAGLQTIADQVSMPVGVHPQVYYNPNISRHSGLIYEFAHYSQYYSIMTHCSPCLQFIGWQAQCTMINQATKDAITAHRITMTKFYNIDYCSSHLSA